jgi:DNA-binding response OmpR family regulator
MTRSRSFQHSRLELDDERREAFWDSQKLDLAPESYMFLQLLAREPDRIYSTADVKDAVGIRGIDEDEEVVTQFFRLKNAFVAIDPNHNFIEVIQRQGYRWNEPSPSILKTLFRKFRGNGK